jgi:DNA recombination protein RmuC
MNDILNNLSAAGWILLCLIPAALIAALSGLIVYHRMQRRVAALREENASLNTRLEVEGRAASERLLAIEQARRQLSDSFAALSGQALKHNSEEFLKLAQENLKQYQLQAQAQLQDKEKSISNLVKPIQDALSKTEQQIQLMEKDRKEAYGSLTRHLETMGSAQTQLQTETRNLVQALRRPEVRGQWGQMTLKRLVELAGMVEYCDFFEEEHRATDDGSIRPDMIVRMPDAREIVVDVKTPLDAYLNAVEAVDDETRKQAMDRHARQVRERVRELGDKAYWQQFKNAPDFVVLFIPGDQFLSAALDRDPGLLEDSMRRKVIIATPTSFIALLRTVAYGWRQQALAENAEHIRDLGEDLYKRLATFTEHLGRLGRSLETGVDSYNKAVGSLERNVMPGARKFVELGIHPKKIIEAPEPLESAVRRVESE